LESVLELCKRELGVESNTGLSKLNSATNVNRSVSGDLSVDDSKVRTSQSPSFKPPKPSHPFVAQSMPQKHIKDILKQIVQSGIDFEKLLEENGIKQKRVGLRQLYQILKEEPSLRELNADDIRQI